MLIKQVKLSKKSIKLSQVARFELVDQLVLAAAAFPHSAVKPIQLQQPRRAPSKCVDRVRLQPYIIRVGGNKEFNEQLQLKVEASI